MRVALKYNGYNARRYSKPWICKIVDWPVGGNPKVEWGTYLGDDNGGEVEIEVQIGDIIRSGQKDHRGGNTSAYWYIVGPDADDPIDTDAAGARKHWLNRQQQSISTVDLSGFAIRA